MNIPVDVRIRQLEINMGRLRSHAGNLGNRYVVVNIPAALVETVENGVVHTRHAAGVGKSDRQSPLLSSKVVEINFNPYLDRACIDHPQGPDPEDAEGAELPHGQQDPHLQRRQRTQPEPGQLVLRRGDPLSLPAGSRRRAELHGVRPHQHPNPHGVYMHDTPSKGIFGDDFRFVSSGCVRVQNVRDYIEWLLKDTPGWSREQIDAAFKSGARTDARLPLR